MSCKGGSVSRLPPFDKVWLRKMASCVLRLLLPQRGKKNTTNDGLSLEKVTLSAYVCTRRHGIKFDKSHVPIQLWVWGPQWWKNLRFSHVSRVSLWLIIVAFVGAQQVGYKPEGFFGLCTWQNPNWGRYSEKAGAYGWK